MAVRDGFFKKRNWRNIGPLALVDISSMQKDVGLVKGTFDRNTCACLIAHSQKPNGENNASHYRSSSDV